MTVLADTIAEVSGTDFVHVRWRLRQAQTEGLIRMAGRGRGAASMSVRDAANALIAVHGAVASKDVGTNIHAFRTLSTPQLKAFGEALEELVASPPVSPVRVTLDQSALYASIELDGRWPLEFGTVPSPEHGDQRRLVSFSQRTLRAVSAVLHGTAPLFTSTERGA